MEISKFPFSQTLSSTTTAQETKAAACTSKSQPFSRVLDEKKQKCPYEDFAEDGTIEYNGVVFSCDYSKNAICLGDTSNPKEVLRISLPSGGSLCVNVHNLGDLSQAMGMFTAADQVAILKAIAAYNHCTSKRDQAEEEDEDIVEAATDINDTEPETDTDVINDGRQYFYSNSF